MYDEESLLFLELEIHSQTCTKGCSRIRERVVLCYRYFSAPDTYAVAHALPSFTARQIQTLLKRLNPIRPGEYI